ncbi:MAG: hypothetical protein EAZ91_20290 [Cytophagales bacterium]|nr:MAG: hypothetical protein EAZ91_20290 [Cytophagales bacterium]
MLHSLLFPYRARYVGWLIFIPAAMLGLATFFYEFESNFLDVPVPSFFDDNFLLEKPTVPNTVNMTNEIAMLGCIIGLFLIGFAREQIEDEFISRMRLEALQWSVVANYAILAVLILVVYGLDFLMVISFNMFTLLLVFIGRMRWLMYRHNHQLLAL